MQVPNTKEPLGRGLSTLIKTKISNEKVTADTSSKQQTLVDINFVKADPNQPRERFDDDSLKELSESIKSYGVLQPILVRNDGDNSYIVIAGERRLRAAKLAGLKLIPVVVKEMASNDILELALIENIQREDLTLIEEAKSYQKLLKLKNYTQEKLAAKIGKSRSHLANLVRLLQLPIEVQDKIAQGYISFGHARALVNAENPIKVAKEVQNQKLTVRQTEEFVKGSKTKNNHVPPNKYGNDDTMFHELPKTLEVVELEQIMSQSLGMKVSIVMSHGSGKVIIHFKDSNELDNIMASIG